MRRLFRAACAACALALAAPAGAQFAITDCFSAAVITNSLGETMPVRVWRKYKPKDLPVPVVVLLHGSGECGMDNAKNLSNFGELHKTVLLDDELPPALWAIPQCTRMSPWVRSLAFQPDYRQPRYPAPALRSVKEWVDGLIAQGVADPDRIYIGGLSLGGFGTWDAIERWPNYFAAAVPVCGGGSLEEKAVRNAATTSIWVFHGERDGNVSVECSRRLVKALREAGAGPKYTEFAGAGHPIWNRVFGDAAVLRWMFRQRRGEPEKAARTDGFLGRLKSYVTPE